MNDRSREQPLMAGNSLEATVAVLIERFNAGMGGVHDRLDQVRIDQSEHRAAAQAAEKRLEASIAELKADVGGLLVREKERNGHIADLVRSQQENERRWSSHREWSNEQASQLSDLVQSHREAELIEGARKGLLSTQARWFVVGAGVAGSVATAIAVVIERV